MDIYTQIYNDYEQKWFDEIKTLKKESTKKIVKQEDITKINNLTQKSKNYFIPKISEEENIPCVVNITGKLLKTILNSTFEKEVEQDVFIIRFMKRKDKTIENFDNDKQECFGIIILRSKENLIFQSGFINLMFQSGMLESKINTHYIYESDCYENFNTFAEHIFFAFHFINLNNDKSKKILDCKDITDENFFGNEEIFGKFDIDYKTYQFKSFNFEDLIRNTKKNEYILSEEYNYFSKYYSTGFYHKSKDISNFNEIEDGENIMFPESVYEKSISYYEFHYEKELLSKIYDKYPNIQRKKTYNLF